MILRTLIFFLGGTYGPPGSDAHAPNPHLVRGFPRTPSGGGMHPQHPQWWIRPWYSAIKLLTKYIDYRFTFHSLNLYALLHLPPCPPSLPETLYNCPTPCSRFLHLSFRDYPLHFSLFLDGPRRFCAVLKLFFHFLILLPFALLVCHKVT